MYSRIETIKSLSAELKRKGYGERIEGMKKQMFGADLEEAKALELKYRAMKRRM